MDFTLIFLTDPSFQGCARDFLEFYCLIYLKAFANVEVSKLGFASEEGMIDCFLFFYFEERCPPLFD